MTAKSTRRSRLDRTARVPHRPLPMVILAAPFLAIGVGLYANYAAGPGLPPELVAFVRSVAMPSPAPKPPVITLPVRIPAPAKPAAKSADAAPRPEAAPPADFAGLFDPAPMVGAVPLARAVPTERMAATPPAAEAPAVVALAPDASPVIEPAPQPLPRPAAAPAEKPAPTPAPSLSERQGPPAPPARLASRPRHQSRTVLAAPAPDTRNLLERVFGIGAPATPALGYAAPQDEAADSPRSRRLGLGSTGGDQTAIYDISARVVYLPNGEKLEAHSGLGEHKDNPRSAHIRMKGVTPPHVYDLTMREAPFHGVRALRLNPVGGNGAIHGRDGLLAHTYLLGPNGDSNGCVSFRDYDRFLKAYLRGEVRRLVVVASLS